MDPLLAWALGCISVAAVLLLIDLFVPSGGLLSIGSAVLAIASVVLLFRYDQTWGVSGLLALLVLAPMAAGFMLKIWPHTPMGRRIIGAKSDEELERERTQEDALRRERQMLVGKEGVVLTDLRPVGVVEIEGRRLEVLSEISYLPAGSRVRVTNADGMQIKVRQA